MKERSTLYYMRGYPLVHLPLEKLNDCLQGTYKMYMYSLMGNYHIW